MEHDGPIDLEEVNNTPNSPDIPDPSDAADAADEIPVPIAMSAAEIDERAQAVQAVGGNPAAITDEELQP